MRRSQVKTLIADFIAATGLASAKINSITERTAGSGVLIGDMLRLPNSGYAETTASGNVTLTTDSAHVQRIDPGGSARDVTLPTGAAGMWYLIVNTADAAENLVVKAAGGTPTVVTLNQNEAALVVHNGTAWATGGVVTIAQT